MIYKKLTEDISVVDIEFLKSKPLVLKTEKGIVVFQIARFDDLWSLYDKLYRLNRHSKRFFLSKKEAKRINIETHLFLQDLEVLVMAENRIFHNLDSGFYGDNLVSEWKTSSEDEYKLLVRQESALLDFEPMEYYICSTKK